ncbi:MULTISPECIES: hypothetical protein [Mameliella]|uniref:NnrU n=1 Tax=Mameliella alba TaxID=561184 RepID=A0A0B3SK79_9RHOB|nr:MULTISPECIES: hypothetical protein [Mameliella]MBV6638001.1 NnrT protein [Mameliella sp.]ODM49799.1 NnrT protein [Ruegeria sp. PBVC088]KHQ50919.1 NnrU [Mameliella alba]MBY6122022.1 NnrT protein [Mameliella alba]MDD9733208.1 NnrT protein [Mameliella sp. AT18]
MKPGCMLVAALYPFGMGAVAVNLFFASLIGSWVGLPVLTPWQAVFWGVPLGLPVAWAFAAHIERLKAEADG